MLVKKNLEQMCARSGGEELGMGSYALGPDLVEPSVDTIPSNGMERVKKRPKNKKPKPWGERGVEWVRSGWCLWWWRLCWMR